MVIRWYIYFYLLIISSSVVSGESSQPRWELLSTQKSSAITIHFNPQGKRRNLEGLQQNRSRLGKFM